MKRFLMVCVMVLCVALFVIAGIQHAYADSGNYDGIDWDLTDGVLTLGVEGETQTLTNKSGRGNSSWPWYSNRTSITSVVTKGNLVMQGSLYGMFYECSGLTSIDVSGWDTSNVTGMVAMFYGCSKLTSLDLSGFDTSNVTNMGASFLYNTGMFYNCSSLTSLDVSGWDTSKVTNMKGVFYNCKALTSLDLSGWDTSNVTTMSDMFGNCNNLTSLNLSGFDTSKVRDMGGMFYSCSKLISLDVSGFNTSNVTDMSDMFGYCNSLTSLDVSRFDTSNVTTMGGMFYNCKALTSLDVSRWNTSKLTCVGSTQIGRNTVMSTSVGGMFENCSSLASLDVSGFDTSKVTSMYAMFHNCSKLSSLDLSGWDTSNVTSITWMFCGCSALTSLDISGFDTSNVEYMTYENTTLLGGVFDSCSNLREVILGENNPFKGKTSFVYTVLPTPPSSKDGIFYTGKWIHDDGIAGPYTPTELKNNYNVSMEGKWVWEAVPMEYTIAFNASSYPATGAMPNVTPLSTEDYTLPANRFVLFGYSFDHWDDGNGHTYVDQGTIPANTYTAGASVTLSAVMNPRDTSVNMQDGSFDFSIRADETALFDPVPANITYQVYEQTPKGWNLIYQDGNAGTLEPLITSEAIFLNQYDPSKVTIRLAGTKLLDEAPAEEGSFVFLLCEDDELIDIVTVQEGGLIEFQPITYDGAGIHQYYISEVVGGDMGINYDTHVEAVTVTVTADDDGGLDVAVDMDDDEILFENVSKPGKIILRKLGVNERDSSMDGTFYYELQFLTANGQPYELFGSIITYAEREGEVSEYPDLQPMEKQKYTLTVAYQRLNMDGTVKSEETSTYEYYAGDVFELNDLGDSLYRYQTAVGLPVMRVGNVFKGVMGKGDSRVELRYEPLRTATIDKRTWAYSVNSTYTGSPRPLRTASSFRQNTSYSSVNDLPSGAIRIDDAATACSIYFWKDGNNAYWWSDAETVYLPADVYEMFYNCSSLTSLDLSGFDTSNVTNMKSMFAYCSGLTSLDLSGWDTSNVTDMMSMFFNCSGLTSLDVSGFDTSNVNEMSNIFYGCSGLKSLDLSGWDTSNVPSMFQMFSGCSGLTSLDVSGFDTSNVTSMYDMFRNCNSLTSLDLSRWDTSKATDMQGMFRSCNSLTSLDLSRWDTSNVTSMGSMFDGCRSLISLGVSGWDTSSVTNMAYMFELCSSLTSLDASGWDTSRVTSMYQMFYECSSLTSLDISGFDTSNVARMDNMYYRCFSLKEVTLGANNPFKGDGSTTATLPWPPSSQNEVTYTQKWIREDGAFGPFTSSELSNNYTSEMQGKWIWEVQQ